MAQISTYPSDAVAEAIEAIEEHHDISTSEAAQLLLEEGLVARSRRYHVARVEAKLDRLLEEFAVAVDDDVIREQAAQRMGLGSPFGGVPRDLLAERPAPTVKSWVERGRGAVDPSASEGAATDTTEHPAAGPSGDGEPAGGSGDGSSDGPLGDASD